MSRVQIVFLLRGVEIRRDGPFRAARLWRGNLEILRTDARNDQDWCALHILVPYFRWLLPGGLIADQVRIESVEDQDASEDSSEKDSGAAGGAGGGGGGGGGGAGP